MALGDTSTKLEPLKPIALGASAEAGAERNLPSSPRVGSGVWLKLLTLVVPTVLAVLYFGLLAANRYESEVKFVVRTPLSSAAGQLTSLMQGSNIVRSADDAYVVHAYIKSRTALRDLLADIKVQEVLAGPGLDVVWWYPLPILGGSEERLHRHFLRFIDVHFDLTTGISTLKVQAFQPNDATRIARALLANAERLINKLNTRVMQDALEIAHREVELSKTTAVDKQLEMTDFRTRWALVDPVKTSGSAHEVITKLSLEAAHVRAQAFELKKTSPQSAQIPTLMVRISALEEQIRAAQRQLVGEDGSLAPRLAEYERYLLFREFAERSFLSAMTALEMARADAQRQKLYLDLISAPLPADHHKYPYRLLSIGLVILLGFAFHTIFRAAGSKP
jgi:capsular polysaccharide transport system permease protein